MNTKCNAFGKKLQKKMAKLILEIPEMNYHQYGIFCQSIEGKKYIHSLLWIERRKRFIDIIRNIREINTGLSLGHIKTYASNAVSMRTDLLRQLKDNKEHRIKSYQILKDGKE